ncbi:MAG TPA: hypothetical protein VFN88_04545 [Caulobacteraceae bacterium]|nr:hypothetical protein [Caulobacteraceae bacterium]
MSIGAIVKGLTVSGAFVACVCAMSSAQAQTQKSPDQLQCEQAGGRWTVDASPPVVEAAAQEGVVAPRDLATGQASGKKKATSSSTMSGQASESGSVSYRAGPGDLDGDGVAAAAATCSLAIKTKGTSAR